MKINFNLKFKFIFFYYGLLRQNVIVAIYLYVINHILLLGNNNKIKVIKNVNKKR